jgi:hypothetical protein
MPVDGNLPGSGEIKSVICDDNEILDKCLSKGDETEFFRTQDPHKIREGDEGEQVINCL